MIAPSGEDENIQGTGKALWTAFEKAIEAALNDYGPGVVLLILAVIGLFMAVQHLWRARVKDKDEEIKRMARSKEVLEKIILKNRQSTDDPPEDEGR